MSGAAILEDKSVMRGLKRGGVWNTLQADVHAPGVDGADLYAEKQTQSGPAGRPGPDGNRLILDGAV